PAEARPGRSPPSGGSEAGGSKAPGPGPAPIGLWKSSICRRFVPAYNPAGQILYGRTMTAGEAVPTIRGVGREPLSAFPPKRKDRLATHVEGPNARRRDHLGHRRGSVRLLHAGGLPPAG